MVAAHLIFSWNIVRNIYIYTHTHLKYNEHFFLNLYSKFSKFELIHHAYSNVYFYLFILFGCASLSCCMWNLWFSLWHMGSLVAVHKLLVVAHGALVPWPEIEPKPPALEVQSLSHWTIKEVLIYHIIEYF